jgi:predicted O-linked N-acetylglucosamine transferase (SPINDLY family)
MGCGDSSAAHAAYKRALRIDANFVQARWGMAMSRLPAIPLSEAEQHLAVKKLKAEILDLQLWFHKKENRQGFLAVGSQQPYYLAYVDGNHCEVLSSYGALCCSLMSTWKTTLKASPPYRQVSGKIRVGIVSAHIHSHSVWHALVRGWLEHLSPRDFELHVFYVGSMVDGETRWAQSKALKLHHTIGPWQRFAEVISASGLDAIIYPEVGIDATTLRLAALRLARIQLAAWGHPITTGLPTIDGYITADAFEPEASATHYSERVFSLPHLGCCYRPFGTRPVPVDITQWGIEPNDTLLICPGTPMKYAPQHDGVWIEIARRCLGCKLVFFQRDNDELSTMLEARLHEAFARESVNFDESVRFIPWQNQASFFGLLDRAAVILDTLGFSGFNTAMQAIECAVPMVAFDGQSLRGRFASGILKEMGLEAWVASTTEHYVQLVEQLARDPEQRTTYADSLVQKRDAIFGDVQSVAALGTLLIELCNKKPK